MSKFPKAVNIQRKFYTMATVDGAKAEIVMYGDIVEQQPTDWWTGQPIEGQYILLSDFMDDLEQIANCKEITIRMNSYGGDAGVSNTIHNRLREFSRNGTKLVCVVDGVAMSGGSLIMCACDVVQVNPSSLIMIHKCWSFIWGGYNADELRKEAEQNDAWDKMQIAIYKRKTALSETEISSMMAETTYMTGKEAVEKGFADELLEDSEPLNIAASADGRSLFVKGRQMHLAPGMFAPDSIPTVTPAATATVEANITTPATPGSQEGGNSMANQTTVPETTPDNVAQQNANANAAASGVPAGDNPNADAIAAAVQAEQNRIQEIDAIAGLFDDDLVQAAKYGEHACSAQELAYRAAQKAAKNGQTFLANLDSDASASGANDVGAAPGTDDGADDGENLTPNQRMENARTDVKALFGKKEG